MIIKTLITQVYDNTISHVKHQMVIRTTTILGRK